jgi:hypothetical protein
MRELDQTGSRPSSLTLTSTVYSGIQHASIQFLMPEHRLIFELFLLVGPLECCYIEFGHLKHRLHHPV